MKRRAIWIASLGLSAAAGLGALVITQGCCRTAPPPGSLAGPTTRAVTYSPAQQLLRLTVSTKDLRNKKGHLLFGVFASADGFPSQSAKAVYWESRAADSPNLTFVCDLPPGRYSASILHDENSNGAMDQNFLGIPQEGYGVTNNPKPRFSAATFEQANFELNEAKELPISLQYFQ